MNYEEFFGRDHYAKLRQYMDTLILWNQKFSLTSVPDDKIFERLIAPSAWLGMRYSEEKIGLIADFGCGPGIPGVPMAIMDRKNRYLLLDSTNKKIRVVKDCQTVPGLLDNSRFEARAIRIEKGSDIERVDRLVTRATGNMTSVARLWKNKVKKAGKADFFKGNDADEEIEALLGAFPGAVIEIVAVPEWFGELKVVRVGKVF